MILPFSTQLNGKETNFVPKIWESLIPMFSEYQKSIPIFKYPKEYKDCLDKGLLSWYKQKPKRMESCKTKIIELGYEILYETDKHFEFEHIGDRVRVFPYSGWCTGKSIKDCRGFGNLLKQIDFDSHKDE